MYITYRYSAPMPPSALMVLRAWNRPLNLPACVFERARESERARERESERARERESERERERARERER